MQQEKIAYQWEFSFKLIFSYKGNRIVIKSVRETEAFLQKWIIGMTGVQLASEEPEEEF